MDDKNVYESLLEEFEDDIDFKVEVKILEITEQICEAMTEKGINRSDLSKLLETSKSAITKMLNGSTNFTLKRLVKIASALNTEVNISFKPSITEEVQTTIKPTFTGTRIGIEVSDKSFSVYDAPMPIYRETTCQTSVSTEECL